MDIDTSFSNETIRKLRKLLGSFNNPKVKLDMYNICIDKTLIKKEEKTD